MNPAEYEAMYRVEDSLWWYTGMRRITAAALDGRLDASGNERLILDAGCGTGGNLRWLSRFGRVYGIDLSPLAADFCRERGLRTVSRASVTRLPFPDASFHLVTSFDVIYHLGVADDVDALAEMRRVLRPGGSLFVRVPAIERLHSAHDVAVHTRQRYTTAELRAKAARAGLAVDRASYANSVLLPLMAAARLARRGGPEEGAAGSAGGAAPQSDVRPLPAPLNAVFGAVLGLEAAWLARADLPVGLSAFVVARRPD
ncbi:MAG TPA: class I SAM-dependent methyltransferase [Chloroflexota bacterium]|nr:class I SAM-dependent methyltransferase [Chloroflexota bacterium]